MNTKNLKLAKRVNDVLMFSAYNKYSSDESKEFKAYMDGARNAIAALSSIEDDIDSITIRVSDENFDNEVEEKTDNNTKTDDFNPIYLRCGYSPTDCNAIDINFALNGENFKFMYNITDDEWVTYDDGYAEHGGEIMNIIETCAEPKRDEIVINNFFDFVNENPNAICGFVSLLEVFKTTFSNVDDKTANHNFAKFLLSMERYNKTNNL